MSVTRASEAKFGPLLQPLCHRSNGNEEYRHGDRHDYCGDAASARDEPADDKKCREHRRRRSKDAETLLARERYGNLAVKLLRTFTAQVEALQRYRGKGQQKVTVEHVHVHAGVRRLSAPSPRGKGARRNRM